MVSGPRPAAQLGLIVGSGCQLGNIVFLCLFVLPPGEAGSEMEYRLPGWKASACPLVGGTGSWAWWPGSFLDEMAVLFLEIVWVRSL